MSSKPLTDKQRAKRKEIVEAAMVCFSQKGFHATSTAEICKEVGMSPGNVFHYFATKDEIIQEIAKEDRELLTEIFERCSSEKTVVDSIVQIIRTIIDVMNHDPISARLSLEVGAEAARNPEVMSIFLENEDFNKQKLLQLIEQGMKNGEIDLELEPEATATWLLMLGDGVLGRSIMQPGFKWEAQLNILEKMIRKALRPECA